MRIVAAGGADITITSPLQAAGADALTNSTSGIPTYDLLSGFNGSTWDRLRALGDDSDGVASASLGRLLALVRLSAFNGSTYDRLLSEGNDRDAIANTTLGNLQTLGFQHVYNGASWDRATLLTDASDAVATDTSFGQGSVNRLTGFNGATYDRVRMLGTASLAGLGQLSVSSALPGAGAVKTLHAEITSTATIQTMLTPTSGKRVRVISIGTGWEDGASQRAEVYFGLGANITSNPASAIFWSTNVQQTAVGSHLCSQALSWPDGGGPVGAVDENVSIRADQSSSAILGFTLCYREE